MEDTRIVSDADVEALMKDWFERNGDTYTYVREHDRIGWEETLDENAAYSSYLIESPTNRDLIKRSYNLAKETLIAMQLPHKVKLTITQNHDSFTDNSIVNVATGVFDEPEFSTGDKIDVFLGLTVHEGSHVLYTDFSVLRKRGLEGVPKSLLNIIEDERIERILGENKPGFARFIEKSKYYYFDKFRERVSMDDKDMQEGDKLMGMFLNIVRYPKYLKKDDFFKYYDYLSAIKKELLPFPSTTDEAATTAEKIWEIIKEFFKEYSSRSPKPKGEGSSDEDEDATKDEDEDATKEPSSEGDSSDIVSSKMLSALKSLSSSSDEGSSLDVSRDVAKDDYLLGKCCEGELEEAPNDVIFRKAIPNRDVYMKDYSIIRPHIPYMQKSLKGHCREYKLTHHSMRSGVLDTGKLAEAFQGVPSVYIREGEVKSDKLALCVVIDESGSMREDDKETSARRAAILINEALKGVHNVELFIYGHTADLLRRGLTEIYIYREKDYVSPFSLGDSKARYENRDGVAIRSIAERVRRQTSYPVIMVVLSDGDPSAVNYRGEPAVRHTKDSVRAVERMGFHVIQVCIDDCYNPSRMFKHFIIMKDLSRLPFDLGGLIRKLVIDYSKIRVS